MHTSERGLPLALRLEETELKRPLQQLAAEILSLCRLSAARAQAARRRDLAEKGFDSTVIRTLGLATDEDVIRAEHEALGDDEGTPPTWMRSV